MIRLRRILGFAAPMALSTLVGAVALPLTIAGLGAEAWARIAVGTAAGSIVGLMVGLGWSITGAARAVAMDGESRSTFLRGSVVIRLALFALIVPPSALLLPHVANLGSTPMASQIALFSAAIGTGLFPQWYYVARANPARMLLFATLPSLLATITAAMAAFATSNAIVSTSIAAVILATGSAIAIGDVIRISRPEGQQWPRPLDYVRFIRAQTDGFTLVVISTVFVELPVLLVARFFPGELSTFAINDRVYRIARGATSPLSQYLQGVIPAAEPSVTVARTFRYMPYVLVYAVTFGAAFALTAPTAVSLLSHGDAETPATLVIPYGCALAAACVSSVIGICCLSTADRSHWLVTSVACGASIGLLLILAAVTFGSTAVLVGLAVGVAEVSVAAVQYIRLHLLRKQQRA